MKPRVVFDCMVFLQAAARKTGPAVACWQLAKTGAVELCVSPGASGEVEDVLTRARTQRKFPELTPAAVDAFLSEVDAHATRITDVPSDFRLERDPKDALCVSLATAANAHYLVSRDKDLLDLMQDEAFRQQFPSLTILDPVSFLRAMARLAIARLAIARLAIARLAIARLAIARLAIARLAEEEPQRPDESGQQSQ